MPPIRNRHGLFGRALASAGVALLVLALGLAGEARADAESRAATITVSGTGEVQARPDQAEVTVGVETRADSAEAAMDANSEAMTQVLSRLEAAGIARNDIATSGLSLHPVHARDPDRSGDGSPRVVGFRAANMVSVRVRDLDTLGGLLDDVVSGGANTLQGIRFIVSDADRRLDEARAAAVKDARRKAEIMAEAAGVKLGAVRRIEAQDGSPGPVFRAMPMGLESTADVPVSPGEQTLSTSVRVVWSLEDGEG